MTVCTNVKSKIVVVVDTIWYFLTEKLKASLSFLELNADILHPKMVAVCQMNYLVVVFKYKLFLNFTFEYEIFVTWHLVTKIPIV